MTKSDKMIPYFVQEIVGHLNGMPGLFISCVFSAALRLISLSLFLLKYIYLQLFPILAQCQQQ